jgi:hypothetical protein
MEIESSVIAGDKFFVAQVVNDRKIILHVHTADDVRWIIGKSREGGFQQIEQVCEGDGPWATVGVDVFLDPADAIRSVMHGS